QQCSGLLSRNAGPEAGKVADTGAEMRSNSPGRGRRHRGRTMQTCDILLVGTGGFAQRIACDLAATASAPLKLACAGRNALRLAWIKTAAAARADMFARPVRITTHALDIGGDGAAELLARLRPAVTVQAASLQAAAVIAGQGNAWTRLVRDGGLSATA